jgi:hypothetical protein
MSRRADTLEAAKHAAVAQRERLRLRLAATRERLTPARLKFDAQQEAERRVTQGASLAVGQVKAHPVFSGVGVAALIAWTFREPLLRHGPAQLRLAWDRLTSHLAFSDDALADGSDPPQDEEEPPPAPVTDGHQT